MKRGRDDTGPSGLAKRQSGPSRAGASSMGHKLTTNDALTYLREVKNRFADKKDVYDTFLEIMKEFKAQRIDTAGVIIRVKELFKGHKELILGFNTFLPKGYEIELAELEEEERLEMERANQAKQPVEFDQAINYVNKIKTRFANDERVYKAFLEILNMYRKGQKTINNVYEEVAVLFRSHNDLLGEFTYFLPDNTPPSNLALRARQGFGRMDIKPRFPMPGGKRKDEAATRAAIAKEMHFFERVKARLRNRDAYQDFLKCLNLFAQEIITKQELVSLVQDILGRYSDLMSGFRDFLDHCECMDMDYDTILGSRPGRLPPGKEAGGKMTIKDKFLSKPISELDLSGCERITTSYVRLPTGYPKINCHGRVTLGQLAGQLNDTWVSVTSGSEDYSFKLFRKNQYEEALFKCEDDRYELDLTIGQNGSALKALEAVHAEMEAAGEPGSEERAAFRLDESALSQLQWRAIKRLYGESGSQLTELLKKNPQVAVPVVLARLEQKDKEWRKARDDMNKLWRKVYDQNYHKSLDHRSFYFKQADKKALAPKAMLQEIKDAVDKRRNDEASLCSVSVACPLQNLLHADITYDYPERDVHDDCYKVVSYYIEETAGADIKARMLDFYLRLVEPFFGLPERQHTTTAHKGEHQHHEMSADSDSDEEGDKPATPLAGAGGDVPNTPEGGAAADASDALTALLAGAEQAQKEEDAAAEEQKEQAAEEGDEHSNDDGTKGFEQCRPLAPFALESSHVVDLQKRGLLYGNDNMYYFLRYHRYLYERMAAARKCCAEKFKPQFKQTAFQTVVPAKQEAELTEAQAKVEAEKLHEQFMKLLLDALDSTIDSSGYEDSCRALLGTSSYQLFTLDKLVHKLVKHMQSMLQDEVTCRLWDLHRYERARCGGQVMEELYLANGHVLLHDDNCYRISYGEQVQAGSAPSSSADTSSTTLAVQLMDTSRSEAPVSATDPVFNDYIKNFLGSGAGENMSQPVYLNRTMPKECRGPAAAAAELDDSIIVRNGLECKINCSNSKVSYVLDTEDILIRQRKAGSRPRADMYNRVKHGRKFYDWIQTQRDRLPDPFVQQE